MNIGDCVGMTWIGRPQSMLTCESLNQSGNIFSWLSMTFWLRGVEENAEKPKFCQSNPSPPPQPWTCNKVSCLDSMPNIQCLHRKHPTNVNSAQFVTSLRQTWIWSKLIIVAERHQLCCTVPCAYVQCQHRTNATVRRHWPKRLQNWKRKKKFSSLPNDAPAFRQMARESY